MVTTSPEACTPRRSSRWLLPFRLVLATLAIVWNADAQEVRLFTGAAPDQGLDLAADAGGSFTHAINFGGPAPLTIRGLTFQPDATIAELNLQANDPIEAWETINDFGNTSADADLATLLHSMRWAEHPAELSFTLNDLEPTASHKLQLLFVEKCCQRGFDILINGEPILEGFGPQQLGGAALNAGIVVSHVLPPGITEINVTLQGDATGFPDPSPVIQAATLEQLSSEHTETDLAVLSLSRNAATVTVTTSSSRPESSYQLSYTESLNKASWIDIGDALKGTGSSITFRDNNPARLAKPTGFYRITRVEPAT